MTDMRLDDYLSTVGVVKRRTIAKELAQNGLVEVGGRRVKPAYQVKLSAFLPDRCPKMTATSISSIYTAMYKL